ncbi:MAG: CAP domain-containing protein [Solirubrobacterales bacterium]
MLRKILCKSAAVLALATPLALAAAPAHAVNVERLMAPAAVCPNQEVLNAPVATQEQAMRCMTNFARRHMGRAGLSVASPLDWSAEDKSGDIIRCDTFSHEACGRRFTFWMQRAGYMRASCWRAGENIAWGTGELGTVRSIFRAWLQSTGHRENILGAYRQLGIGLRVGTMDGRHEAHVWTQHFGSHC